MSSAAPLMNSKHAQVNETYVFTVADSARVDSFEIMVEPDGHNAIKDFTGPAKVRS